MGALDMARNAQKMILWLVVLGVLGLAGLGVKVIVDKVNQPNALVDLSGATFRVQISQTEPELARGLAGRTRLDNDEAMLFVFSENKTWGIWMKGMKMSIDIVWLDEQKRVVHVEENIQPDAEPYEVYEPPVPARYVLEMKAGSVKKFSIKKDAIARLYNNSGVE